ncbi:MAG: non-canonical purine NTP diphosphatase [Bacteroidetes bacterium]|uniref:dITP/XTP pyrophosphatase n=1 Tax=Candidatus Caccoplasma merdipullorum TaxID=2840718 RepID=A0A9D9H7R4_9BACT|nr:non-canonical purine NTP diphosphatase [Candidatus Caccoplasma merdipullorum]
MKKLVFATNNAHKLREVREMLEGEITVLSLADIGCSETIPETADTLQGNALIKARYIKTHYGYDCFADDTGLQVVQLGGRPGVYSARYAGEECDPEKNMQKLLGELEGIDDRRASFITVVALIQGEEEKIFEGEVKGRILEEKQGSEGFGYDPLFVPDGYEESFAQLGEETKNHISHRARAMQKMKEYLLGK